MSEERRRFTRVSFDSKCFVLEGEASHDARLLDISLKGALIELVDPSIFRPEKKCDMRIALGGSSVELKVCIKMIHERNGRIGVSFINIDIDSLTHLRKLIELNVGDADRTLQELFLWTAP